MRFLLIALACAPLWAAEEPRPSVQPAPKPALGDAAAESDPTEQAYRKLLEADEAALEEIDKWVQEFQAFEAQGAAGPRGTLLAKIDQKIETVRKGYNEFLERHPKHVNALIAYGSFLNEIDEEAEAIEKWEKARELAPNNPTPWNNLANMFGHIGPTKKALQYYERAIELDPTEPIYVQNLATTVYLFRKDAAEMYRIDEEGVFNKALELYRRAMKLDPNNLVLATDYAQSYYGIRPARVEDALSAWKHALTLTKNDLERESIYTHMARVEMTAGRFEAASQHLDLVRHPDLQELLERLRRSYEQRKRDSELRPAGGESRPSEALKSEGLKSEAPKSESNPPGREGDSSSGKK